MDKRYLREENENKTDYLLRLVEIRMTEKPEDLDWADIVDYCNLDCHYDSLRKAFQPAGYGAYAIYKYMKDNKVTDNEMFRKLEEKEERVKIEVQKLRDLKLGVSERLRQQSRKESILEEIKFYLENLEPLYIPDTQPMVHSDGVKAIGGVADAHFGKDITIYDLNEEIMNIYNEQVFADRMWSLFDNYVEIFEEEGITSLTFFDLSDSIEGLLRMSGLQHIKYGIVESAVKYGRFMANWLNELSRYVEIDYYACLGNHNEIRPLGSKVGDFAKENMQYVIDEIITAYLVNNDRVKVNKTKGLQYVDIDGYKVLATHGQDEKNLVNSVKEYKEMYKVDFDLMLSGHFHNGKQETASMHTKIMQFPSIIGIDFYSLKLKKTAKAEGRLILVKPKRLINIDIELD